jgi:hypothetical protein
MRFHLKNSNLFLVPGNQHMLHLGTIGYGLREFIVMACIRGSRSGQVYIEEVVLTNVNFSEDVFANCKFIEDDNLAFDLAKYAEEQGITDVRKRLNELGETGRLSWITGSQT